MISFKKNKPNSQNVIEKIQQLILDGELEAGDKLAPERELAAKFAIGRPALREALRVLEVMGLVEKRHGQGNFIVNHIQESHYKPLALSFLLQKGSVQDILELRFAMELHTAALAAAKATDADIAALYALHDSMVKAETRARSILADRGLHFEIARISGNKLILGMMENLTPILQTFIEKTVQISERDDDSIEHIYDEHLAVIKAIECHDGRKAAEAMAFHLSKIHTTYLEED